LKRIFSFFMAAVMILIMTPTLFAVDDDPTYLIEEIWEQGYLLDEDDRYVDFGNPIDDCVPYGETVYYPLISRDSSDNAVAVYENKAAKKIKIRTDWDEGSSYIDELSVVRKRYTNKTDGETDGITFADDRYAYFLSVTTKQRSKTTTSTNEIYGLVQLKKTGDYNFDYDAGVELYVQFDVGYTDPEDSNYIPIIPALFLPDEHFGEDSEETFDFEADDNSYFVVNTNSQKKIVLGLDTDYDDDIGEKYPDADLMFFNGNGARFNKLGYLYLYTGDSDYRYTYMVNDDGELEKVNSTYDSHDECVVIRTRTLGRYVLSDTKLKVIDNTDDHSGTEVIFDNDTQQNYNPGTGGYPWEAPDYYQPAVVTAPAAVAPAPAAPEKVEEKTEQKKAPEVIETAVTVEKAIPEFATILIGENDGDITADSRMMLVVACCVGAVACVMGLVLCVTSALCRKRSKY